MNSAHADSWKRDIEVEQCDQQSDEAGNYGAQEREQRSRFARCKANGGGGDGLFAKSCGSWVFAVHPFLQAPAYGSQTDCRSTTGEHRPQTALQKTEVPIRDFCTNIERTGYLHNSDVRWTSSSCVVMSHNSCVSLYSLAGSMWQRQDRQLKPRRLMSGPLVSLRSAGQLLIEVCAGSSSEMNLVSGAGSDYCSFYSPA